MIGAIIGDMVGSRFEKITLRNNTFKPDNSFEFFVPECHFTDDTVLTIAVAESFMYDEPLVPILKKYGNYYFDAGYGARFKKWLKQSDSLPYNSWGNGSAMRVSSIAYIFDDEVTVLEQAKFSAEVTHNHPEGIKGAQAVALAVLLARKGCDKASIKQSVVDLTGYDLDRSIEDIRPSYKFDVSCQGSVPEAIISFLESTDFEDTIRTAISLGGDTDTIACIAGSIAAAFYDDIPSGFVKEAKQRLDSPLLKILEQFEDRYQ